MVKKKAKALPIVEVGSIWVDNDPRHPEKRRFVVIEVKARGRVIVMWMTGASKDKTRELKQERFNGRTSGYSQVMTAAERFSS